MAESYGTLIVSTRAAHGAVPVVGAAITVYCMLDGVEQPCQTVRTDISGQTAPIQLPAPSLEDADPDTPPPYTAYRVDIDHPQYRPVTVTDVALFSGVTTTLPVSMIPPRSVDELRSRIVINSSETGPTGSGKQNG